MPDGRLNVQKYDDKEETTTMTMSSMLGSRFKETPADCQLDSHKLMIRGGYMKQMTTGIYSLYMPGKRIMKKIEAIIRD